METVRSILGLDVPGAQEVVQKRTGNPEDDALASVRREVSEVMARASREREKQKEKKLLEEKVLKLQEENKKLTSDLNNARNILHETSDEIRLLQDQMKGSWKQTEKAIFHDLPEDLISPLNRSRLVHFLKKRIDGESVNFSEVKPSIRHPSVKRLGQDFIRNWKKLTEAVNDEASLFLDERMDVLKEVIEKQADSDKTIADAMQAVKKSHFEAMARAIFANHKDDVKKYLNQQLKEMRMLSFFSDKIDLLSKKEFDELVRFIILKRMQVGHSIDLQAIKKLEAMLLKDD